MKKFSAKSKIIILIAVIALLSGVGLLFYNRYRISYQNSIKYIELALSSLERAERYLRITELIQTISYIVLAVAGLALLIGIISSLKNAPKEKKKTKAVTTLNQQEHTRSNFCMKCGNKLKEGEHFCSKCGNALK